MRSTWNGKLLIRSKQKIGHRRQKACLHSLAQTLAGQLHLAPGNRTAALHEVEVLMSVTLVFIFYSCLKRACFSFSRKINQLCIIKMGGGGRKRGRIKERGGVKNKSRKGQKENQRMGEEKEREKEEPEKEKGKVEKRKNERNKMEF